MAVKKETVEATEQNKEATTKATKTTTKTTATKATTAKDKTTEADANTELLKTLMAQMEAMKAELEATKQEKSSMSELVEALKGETSTNKTLPQRVKVISLVDNTLVLSTLPNGGGTVFTFPKFGHAITIRTTQLEDILSVQAYRMQAEEPLFYICDASVVEDQQLTDVYENIDKDRVEYIKTLSEDLCVDLFCGLGERLKESIVSHFVENIAKHDVAYDRNRLGAILERTGIDIEAKAKDMKQTLEVIKKRTNV